MTIMGIYLAKLCIIMKMKSSSEYREYTYDDNGNVITEYYQGWLGTLRYEYTYELFEI